MYRGHVNEQLHTTLANTGRVSGMGISYDRYDEESGCPRYDSHKPVMLPSDYLTEDELKALTRHVAQISSAHVEGHMINDQTINFLQFFFGGRFPVPIQTDELIF